MPRTTTTILIAFLLLLAACKGGQQSNGTMAADTVYHKLHNSLSRECDTFQSQHYTVPRQKGYINDYEDLLSDAEEAVLSDSLKDYQARTGNQVALVTLTPNLTGVGTFDCYSLLLANTWGLSNKKGIVITISQEYHIMRINVGKDLQATVSGQTTKNICDSAFIPSFIMDKYEAGISRGLSVIMETVK